MNADTRTEDLAWMAAANHELGRDVNVTSPHDDPLQGRRTRAGAAKDGRTVPASLPARPVGNGSRLWRRRLDLSNMTTMDIYPRLSPRSAITRRTAANGCTRGPFRQGYPRPSVDGGLCHD